MSLRVFLRAKGHGSEAQLDAGRGELLGQAWVGLREQGVKGERPALNSGTLDQPASPASLWESGTALGVTRDDVTQCPPFFSVNNPWGQPQVASQDRGGSFLVELGTVGLVP